MSRLKKAMLRAQEAREANGDPQPSPPVLGKVHGFSPLVREPEPEPPGEPRDEVDPAYVRTRVEEADLDTLLRNKVWTLSHDDGISDQVKILRTQVLDKLAERRGRTLLVTSPNPGEGKTFTAVNLAVSLSHEVNRTTLLVDADLRNPSVQARFGLTPSDGLSDYLMNRGEISDLLVNPGIPKLTILPGGTPLRNSAELLGAPRMKTLVEEMRRRYPDRYIIFDSAPLLTSADPLISSQFIDGVLLVVEAESTTSADLARALGLLEDRPLLGIVFNKAR